MSLDPHPEFEDFETFEDEAIDPETIAASDPDPSGHPLLMLSGNMVARAAAVMAALERWTEEPFLFRRDHDVLRVLDEGTAGRCTLDTLDRVSLRTELCKHFRVQKSVPDKKNGGYVYVDTDMDVMACEYLLVGHLLKLPSLYSLCQMPVFYPDGRLATHGYHQELATYVDCDYDFQIPEVPTQEQVQSSLDFIFTTWLGDFPFVTDADRATALAAMCVVPMRALISGCTPWHLVTAPSQGTGKDFLARGISVVSTGSLPNEIGLSCQQSDEIEKRLAAVLDTGPSAISLANLTGKLDSDDLARALTSKVYTFRPMGVTKSVTVPVRNLWVGSANNLVLSRDLTRRTNPIRLDAGLERPWERSFDIPDFEKWTEDHRFELFGHIAVICRNWFVSGQPLGDRPFGNFRGYAAVMGGVLAACSPSLGEAFLTHLTHFYDEADDQDTPWIGFVAAWWEKTPKETDISGQETTVPMSAGDLVEMAAASGVLSDDDRAKGIKLGKALRARIGRIFNGLRICRAPRNTHAKVAQFRLEVAPANSHGDSVPADPPQPNVADEDVI